jgi:hypothetical protein
MKSTSNLLLFAFVSLSLCFDSLNAKIISSSSSSYESDPNNLCPGGEELVHCLRNPCDSVRCSTGSCLTDYCGGCNAR